MCATNVHSAWLVTVLLLACAPESEGRSDTGGGGTGGTAPTESAIPSDPCADDSYSPRVEEVDSARPLDEHRGSDSAYDPWIPSTPSGLPDLAFELTYSRVTPDELCTISLQAEGYSNPAPCPDCQFSYTLFPVASTDSDACYWYDYKNARMDPDIQYFGYANQMDIWWFSGMMQYDLYTQMYYDTPIMGHHHPWYLYDVSWHPLMSQGDPRDQWTWEGTEMTAWQEWSTESTTSTTTLGYSCDDTSFENDILEVDGTPPDAARGELPCELGQVADVYSFHACEDAAIDARVAALADASGQFGIYVVHPNGCFLSGGVFGRECPSGEYDTCARTQLDAPIAATYQLVLVSFDGCGNADHVGYDVWVTADGESAPLTPVQDDVPVWNTTSATTTYRVDIHATQL